METLMTQQTVSMSEFKRKPASVLRAAKRRPVAVLSHNKAAFYMVDPALFEAMLDQMADRYLENLLRSRLTQKAQAISVDIDTV